MNAIAGINGGYFYRTDVHDFLDDVCLGKFLSNAQAPVDCASNPDNGLGDSLVIINGTYYSCNCDLIGNSAPAILNILNGKCETRVLRQGEQMPPGTENAIGSGPNLLTNGKTDIDG
jgi:hypothetical protein